MKLLDAMIDIHDIYINLCKCPNIKMIERAVYGQKDLAREVDIGFTLLNCNLTEGLVPMNAQIHTNLFTHRPNPGGNPCLS